MDIFNNNNMSSSRPTFNNDRYYAGSDTTQPTEAFSVAKAPDPLSADWNYDNAIDLFSVNSMLPDMFPIDLPDPASLEPDYFSDPLAPPSEISGFAVSSNSTNEPVSHQSPSDFDSDDALWSPTCQTLSPLQPTLDLNMRGQTPEISTSEQSQVKQESVSSPSSCSEGLPERTSTSSRRPSRRQKESPSSLPASSGKAAKRAAHNVIEKRYRTNMNAKFVALEDATCGGVNKPTTGESRSLKKSEILANAISYVHNLQEENKALQKELLFYKQNCGQRGWRQPRRSK